MADFGNLSEERAYLRRVARVLALKALFEADLSPHLAEEALDRMAANLPVEADAAAAGRTPGHGAPVRAGVPSLGWLPEDAAPEPFTDENPDYLSTNFEPRHDRIEPVAAASFGGDGIPPIESEELTPEPGIDDEEPATPGPMEPLSGQQAQQVEGFARTIVHGVGEHRDEVDAVIHEVAPQWPVADLPAVDRNLLRIALYEVLFARETPVRAAISEAVDLASEYGGDSSPRFVNGVLGAAARRFGNTAGPR